MTNTTTAMRIIQMREALSHAQDPASNPNPGPIVDAGKECANSIRAELDGTFRRWEMQTFITHRISTQLEEQFNLLNARVAKTLPPVSIGATFSETASTANFGLQDTTPPGIKQAQYPNLRYPYDKDEPSPRADNAIDTPQEPEFPSPKSPMTHDQSDKFTPEEHRSILNRYINQSKRQS